MQLLDAAVDAIRARGPGVTMEQIARAGDVTKPILYRHFGDKGGLYAALAERYTGVLLARLQAALEAGRDRRDRVSRTVEAYLAAIEREPQVYRFLVHSDDPASSQVRSFVRRLSAQLAVGIGQELAVPASRADAWGHGIVGMVQAAGDWWLEAGPADERLPREQLVQELTDLLFGAYGTS